VTAERDEARKRAEIAELTLRRANAYFDNDALGTMPARTVLNTLAQIRGRAEAAWEEVHESDSKRLYEAAKETMAEIEKGMAT